MTLSFNLSYVTADSPNVFTKINLLHFDLVLVRDLLELTCVNKHRLAI